MGNVEKRIFLVGNIVLVISIVSVMFSMPMEFRSEIYPKIGQFYEKLEDINDRFKQIDVKIETTNEKVRELGLLLGEFIEKFKKVSDRVGSLEEKVGKISEILDRVGSLEQNNIIRRRYRRDKTIPDILGTHFGKRQSNFKD